MTQTISDLQGKVDQFNDDRNWHQFHTPKSVAVSITIEAAELLEHFQWTDILSPRQIPNLTKELADVVIYCLTLANRLDIDLGQAVCDKIEENEIKYPVNEYYGRF